MGIFNTSCSHEFYLVAKHFELTEKELWELGYNAIDSIFGPQEKKERLKELFIGWKEIEGLL